MTETTRFDAIILGSGQAGNPLLADLSAKGWKVALVERAAVGGTCGNYGCTPTKTMVASADTAYLARRAGEYGVHLGEVSVDMVKVRDRKRAMVEMWRQGTERRIKKAEHAELFRGEGSFQGPKEVLIRLNEGGERVLTADVIVIDTGLSPAVPPVEGIREVPYLDNVSVMELGVVPEHLLVLGGGYIGLEFAQMFHRFGSKVTVIQKAGQLLPREDTDVAEEIDKVLREDGLKVMLNTTAKSVRKSGAGIALTVEANGATSTLEGTHLLAATGRVPNTAVLNLKAAGVTMDEHGFIDVDERLETNVKGVYAVGDVKGGPAFTHISYDDYRVLKQNLLNGGGATIANRLVPYCVFIDPQLGRIGLSEREAKEQGRKVKVAKLPMSSVARALETGNTRGFLKALVDPETDQILGAAILGADGGEIMSMIEIAMMGRVPASALQSGTFAHPLYAEALNTLFSSY